MTRLTRCIWDGDLAQMWMTIVEDPTLSYGITYSGFTIFTRLRIAITLVRPTHIRGPVTARHIVEQASNLSGVGLVYTWRSAHVVHARWLGRGADKAGAAFVFTKRTTSAFGLLTRRIATGMPQVELKEFRHAGCFVATAIAVGDVHGIGVGGAQIATGAFGFSANGAETQCSVVV